MCESKLVEWSRIPRRYYKQVKHVISWLPFLWKDRDWDYSYLLEMMKEKVGRMEKEIDRNANHVGYKKTVHQLKVARLLLDRLIKDSYCEKGWEEHWEKYGHSWDRMVETGEGRCLTIPSSPEESSNVRKLADKEYYMWQQDMKYLGEWFRKHIKKWWD